MSDSVHLEAFLGPMFAGKTSVLLRKLEDASILYPNEKSYFIVHSLDKQRDILSHSKIIEKGKDCIEVYYTENLMDFYTDVLLAQSEVVATICIDEAQFFKDLFSFVSRLINEKEIRNIYIGGLDGDYKMQPFPNSQIFDILPLCNSFVKLNAVCCSVCSELGIKNIGAPFTKLKSGKVCGVDSVLIGSEDFIPVCRMHFDS